MRRGIAHAAISIAVLAGGATGVSVTRARLAPIARDVKEKDDVYAFPPPDEMPLVTLGYDAAAVDVLWATLLVAYGTHWQEKRAFPDVPRYLDAILALEPDYEPLYRFADTLIVYRPPRGTEADVRLARRYLERGTTDTRKYDWHVWMEYGQFIAFLAPSFLTSQDEKDQWRRDGAKAIARAVELGADPDRSITAASILAKYGERDAAIQSLRRAYVTTTDPAEREELGRRLDFYRDEAQRESLERDVGYLEAEWRAGFPFLPPIEFILVMPEIDAARCAGPESTRAAGDVADCARDWDARLPSAREAH